MTEISEDTKISYAGRFEYLAATQRHWPELLASLPKICHRNPKRAWPATFSELQSMPEHRKCAEAIRAWARRYAIKDEWMVDAAVQTVGIPKLGRWHYTPSSLPIPAFAPRFGIWLPSPTSPWSYFRETTARKFLEEL